MSFAFTWTWSRRLGVATLVVASGTTGWALGHAHGGWNPAPAGIADARAAAQSPVPATHRPEIQSFADGTLSVHVDRVAVGWLMSELARDGAVPEVPGPIAADDTVAVSEASCEPADEDPGAVGVELLERILAEGTESERHSALTQALEAGIDLPPELLQQTYASDPSESVRLLAFATYVDAVSDDREKVRATLQSGIYNDSSAVQAEAQRRLTELERYERMLAQAPSQGVP